MMHSRHRHRFTSLFAMFLGVTCCVALIGAGPSGSPGDDDPPQIDDDDKGAKSAADKESTTWKKLKEYSGQLKQKEYLVKFQPKTDSFRVKFTVTPDEKASYTQVRAYLMVETIRDDEGKPFNWNRRDKLFDGNIKKTGKDDTGELVREFDGGLNKDGKPKWFAVQVSGYGGKYEVMVEDHSSSSSGGKKSKKKKSE